MKQCRLVTGQFTVRGTLGYILGLSESAIAEHVDRRRNPSTYTTTMPGNHHTEIRQLWLCMARADEYRASGFLDTKSFAFS
jgi:hypothetical protein